MAPIGIELKRERELRGITLQEIADATKINIRYLRDLEEERLDNLPGSFFIKGIIRSFAKYIGLDESTILNSYYESELHREQEQEEQEEESQKTQSMLPTKVKRILYSILLFLALMAILTLIWFIFFHNKPQEQQVGDTPTAQIIQEPASTPLPKTPILEEEKELILDLTFAMETWIQIFADGELVIEGLKIEGEKVQVIAKEELLIHTGNAGGFSVSLNNKKGLPFGESGAVVKDIRITHENMDTFIIQEEESVSI